MHAHSPLQNIDGISGILHRKVAALEAVAVTKLEALFRTCRAGAADDWRTSVAAAAAVAGAAAGAAAAAADADPSDADEARDGAASSVVVAGCRHAALRDAVREYFMANAAGAPGGPPLAHAVVDEAMADAASAAVPLPFTEVDERRALFLAADVKVRAGPP